MSSDVITHPTWNRLHFARRVRDIAKSMTRLSRLGRSIVPMVGPQAAGRGHHGLPYGFAGRADRDARWMIRRGRSIEMIDRLLKHVGGILDRPLTRTEVAARLGESFGTKRVRSGRGWGKEGEVDAFEVGGHPVSVGGLLSYACVRGIACAGPPQGNEGTFVRPDVWFPRWRDLSVRGAEDALLRVHLRAHGPATPTDFAWWTYVTATAARAIWDRSAEDLAPLDADGRITWVLREDLPILKRASLKGPIG